MEVVELQKLIAEAGARQVERLAARAQEERKTAERDAAEAAARNGLRELAREWATDLFQWADSDVGMALRVAVRDAGLARISLSANISLPVTPGMLHVYRRGGPAPYGGFGIVNKDISDVSDLFVVRDEEIVAVAEAIRSGSILDVVAKQLKAFVEHP
jgi:hypothetical protein